MARESRRVCDDDARAGAPAINLQRMTTPIALTPPARIALADAVLRPWTVDDAERLAAALAASEVHLRPWTPWVIDGKVPGLSLEERLARHAEAFAAGVEWVYGILSPDGAVLGGCGLYPRVGPGGVEVGYWLAAGATGRGLATRAAAAMTEVAFGAPAIDRVEIHCERRNAASARVPRRLGYTLASTIESREGMMLWRLHRAEWLRDGLGARASA